MRNPVLYLIVSAILALTSCGKPSDPEPWDTEVSGIVTGNLDKQPLPNVHVIFYRFIGNRIEDIGEDTTNSNGQYRIKFVQPGQPLEHNFRLQFYYPDSVLFDSVGYYNDYPAYQIPAQHITESELRNPSVTRDVELKAVTMSRIVLSSDKPVQSVDSISSYP